MKASAFVLSVCLLFGQVLPARADFKYTSSSKITGGSLYGAIKFAGTFNKKMTAPTVTTHYIKGNRLRTDEADGKIEIIDLDARQIIQIDPSKRTYSVVTFEEMKAAMQKAMEDAKQKAAKNGKDPNNAQVTVTPKIQITPGVQGQVINGQTTNEVKTQIDMEMQGTDQQTGQTGSATTSVALDSYVAPSVTGFQEFGEFYKRMAKEIDWMPRGAVSVNLDPRAVKGLEEAQKSSASLKGLPILQYMSMSMVGQNGATASQSQNASGSGTSSSSDNNVPTSASGAVLKGLGGMFGKKKKQEDNADASAGNKPPAPSNPNSLMDMTIETTSFSDSSLDASLFDIPAGYTKVQSNTDDLLGPKAHK